MDVTHRLGGANYVLWGGREGYDTLLNTDLRRERQQLGRFMRLVVEHKHASGFPARSSSSPNQWSRPSTNTTTTPQRCTASCSSSASSARSSSTSRRTTRPWRGTASSTSSRTPSRTGCSGSVDANRGDAQNGWDTDQFPNSPDETALALYTILQGGGLTTGGFNFDAKLRRQSIAPDDLLHAHVGGMDAIARGLLRAARMIERGDVARFVAARYADWDADLGRAILAGERSLADLERHVVQRGAEPAPRSGRQEMLENLVNRDAL